MYIFLLGLNNSKPTLKEIHSFEIISKVSPKWQQLGLALLDDDEVSRLEIIQANNNDVIACCTALFSYWLQAHPNANWHDVVVALKEPGVEMNALAADVENKFIGEL